MTQRTANRQLKKLIDESGLPYDGIARAVRAVASESGQRLGTNKSAVHHWILGAEPSGATPGYLAEALSRRLGRRITREDLGLGSPVGGEDENIGLTLDFDPIETLTAIGEADVNRRRFLAIFAYSMAAAMLPLETVQEAAARTRTIRSGAVAGHADVAAVRDMVKLFMDMDERHGGQHGRSAFAQYLVTDVASLCRGRFASDEARAEALSVASAGAHLAGWKAYDSGEQGLAQRYYLQSLALARASNIPGQDGFVMRTMSQQGMKLHRPEHCLALAETGWDRAKGRVDGQVEALFAITHAHALAKTGQTRRALADVDRAQAALAAGDEVPVLGAGVGAACGHRPFPYGEGVRDARRPPQRGPPVRDGSGQPSGHDVCADHRPRPGRASRATGQAGQHRAGVYHLGPRDRHHGRGEVRSHPQGYPLFALRPATVPGPRRAVRRRTRRARPRLPRPPALTGRENPRWSTSAAADDNNPASTNGTGSDRYLER
ncbi:hypothetical protein YWIDRAFT_06510 [Streptomyces sp. SceaMP-e96]|uniref:hypothetical protein n=1 Tax=unclassified Streptomyces TaxID=2593676 RepID=UPI0008237847|nr:MULTISPECIES: hypothetical protein [unclassified Streptomyces]SCK36131.1 hypothetical protein YWIDRAFT_06510 [Streptomyces sp. SceaMP-e96]